VVTSEASLSGDSVTLAKREQPRREALGSERLVIAGGPRTGKTTLAAELAGKTGAPVHHTDDLIGGFAWSDASAG
jgi:hypothetical protein